MWEPFNAEFQIAFSRSISQVGTPPAVQWSGRVNGGAIAATGVVAVPPDVFVGGASLGPQPGPDVVSYTGIGGGLVDDLGRSLQGFANFPVTVLP